MEYAPIRCAHDGAARGAWLLPPAMFAAPVVAGHGGQVGSGDHQQAPRRDTNASLRKRPALGDLPRTGAGQAAASQRHIIDAHEMRARVHVT